MVFMLRLIPGLLLLLYTVESAEITKLLPNNVDNPSRPNNQTTRNVYGSKDNSTPHTDKITDQDIENIVKPFKFSTRSYENQTTISLKKSEPYTTQRSTQINSRTGSGRFVDIDIEKFISPDIHNAVYTSPNTNTVNSRYQNQEAISLENLAPLTTPQTPFFDQKFREAVESVNKNIDSDFDNLTQITNYTANNYIEGSDEPADSRLEYKIFDGGEINETKSIRGTHQDITQEKHLTLSYESKNNHTTIHDETTPNEESNELHKDNIKYLLADENNDLRKTETNMKTLAMTDDSQSTTKRYSITKPSTAGSDVGIISNKIESDTIKSERTTTPTSINDKFDTERSSKNNTRRGSIKFADYQKLTSAFITTLPTTTTKSADPIVQENQVIPVQLTPIETTSELSFNKNNTDNQPYEPTTTKIENVASRKTDNEPYSQQSTTLRMEDVSSGNNAVQPGKLHSTTIYVFVQPETTIFETTTQAEYLEEQTTFKPSSPRGFVAPTRSKVITPSPRGLSVATIRQILTSTARGFTTTTTIEPITSTSHLPGIDSDESTSTNEISTSRSEYLDRTSATGGDSRTTRTTTLPEFPTESISTEKLFSTVVPSTTKTMTETASVFAEGDNDQSEHTTTPTTTTVFSEHVDQTTFNEPRSSKGIKFVETTTLEITTGDSTELGETTSINPITDLGTNKIEETTFHDITTDTVIAKNTKMVSETTDINDARESKGPESSTKIIYTEVSPNENNSETVSTETPTSTATVGSTDGKSFMVTAFRTNQNPFTQTYPKSTYTETTSEVITDHISHDYMTTITTPPSYSTPKIIIKTNPTKTLLENRTNEEKTTEELETSTTISFVHIKNIDVNHTTLFPDVLKPNEKYTPDVAPETVVRTTTETFSTDDATSSPSELDGHGGNNGAIVAIVIFCVGGICLVVLAGLLIVMRNRQKRFNYGQRCRPVNLDDYSVDNVSVFNSVRRKTIARGSKRSYGNPAFEDPVCVSHPLNFPAISKFASNMEDVHAEFNDIPQITARTSELPEGCETKNRYANVIPLPESRVFLTPLEGYPNSDYINANYITGPRNIRKYYIACQAPMSNTVDDFWRMIWEQQCKVVLMLTHLFENGTEKCFDYLPPSEVLDCHRLFGDYQVTLKKREVKEKYIISSIQLKNMVSNSWREVTHFWYMGWPEKGVPAEANSIIAFLIEARSYMKSTTIDKKNAANGEMNGSSVTETNPVVVHCSPGTGRTGAVITCDIAIREFEQTRQVDIPKIVYRIRRDRANAVQTREQYAFIYKVIDMYATKLAGGSLESI